MTGGADASKGKRSGPLVLNNIFASLAVREFRLLWIAIVFMMGMLPMMSIAQGFLAYKLTGSAKV